MNKKEIAEIKKTMSVENCCISRISGCYVNDSKVKVSEFTKAFVSLPEEDQFMYLDIFKKVLTGKEGKNLLNLSFPTSEEEKGGKQEALYSLEKSTLADAGAASEYFDSVIEAYNNEGSHFLVLAIHAAYDVPGKGKDSEEVFSFLVSCICPVSLTKQILSYDAEKNFFANRSRDWVAGAPVFGFMFPAFNDRTSDIHNILFYMKKTDGSHKTFASDLFGCCSPVSADEQARSFRRVIENTLGEDRDFETIRDIHCGVHTLLMENGDQSEPVSIDAGKIQDILEDAGVSHDKLEEIPAMMEEENSGKEYFAENCTAKTIMVKSAALSLHIDARRADSVRHKLIDGQHCLVIPITSDMEVDGIRVCR